MEYLGAWGTLIHEKNLKSKISCQTPFNRPSFRENKPKTLVQSLNTSVLSLFSRKLGL
jgi:hypothetical protein